MSRVCRQAGVPFLYRLLSEIYLVKVPSIIEPLIHFLFHLVQRCHLSLVPVPVNSLLAFKLRYCQLLLFNAGRGGFLPVEPDEILGINGGALGLTVRSQSHIVEYCHCNIIIPVNDNSRLVHRQLSSLALSIHNNRRNQTRVIHAGVLPEWLYPTSFNSSHTCSSENLKLWILCPVVLSLANSGVLSAYCPEPASLRSTAVTHRDTTVSKGQELGREPQWGLAW